MTIIIKHLDSGNEYILLSLETATGKASLSSRVFNDLFTSDQGDKYNMILACDAQGRIISLRTNEVIITEIDGQKPFEILPETIPAPSQPLLYDTQGENPPSEDFSPRDEDEEEDWI